MHERTTLIFSFKSSDNQMKVLSTLMFIMHDSSMFSLIWMGTFTYVRVDSSRIRTRVPQTLPFIFMLIAAEL